MQSPTSWHKLFMLQPKHQQTPRSFWCGAGKHESRSAEEGASASERIAIVTGIPTSPCTNPYGDYLLSLSIQNKQVTAATYKQSIVAILLA